MKDTHRVGEPPERVPQTSERARILLIDNYDSFTFNLVQAFRVLGAEVLVHRNDRITVERALALSPSHLVISPGPGRPEAAGLSMALIDAFADHLPILGVCLGHQALAATCGGRIRQAARLMHGKRSRVSHDGSGLFHGLDAPMLVGRYHSLAVERCGLPRELTVIGEDEQGEIMAIRHETLPLFGVQFHPESVLTPQGAALLKNFLLDQRVADPPGRAGGDVRR